MKGIPVLKTALISSLRGELRDEMAAFPRVTLYYDVVSPYSLFAMHTLTRYEKARPTFSLHLRPFFLGGVMAQTGNRPPATVPAKAKYLSIDLKRNAEYFETKPMKMPPIFPANTLFAMRVLTYLSNSSVYCKREVDVAFAIWNRYWHIQASVVEKDDMIVTLAACGFEPNEIEEVLIGAVSDENKELLKNVTTQVVENGAFGAPTIFVQKDENSREEMYFGSDRFQHLFPSIGIEWVGPNPQKHRL